MIYLRLTNNIKELKKNINKESILFFDLDGTLIDTDKANFLSYKEAVEKLKRLDLRALHKSNSRFTHKDLYSVIQTLTHEEYNNILKLKKYIYKEYLYTTKVNYLILKTLREYKKTNIIILATSSSKDRAELVLNYHDLLDVFDYKYFKEDYTNKLNKFEYILKCLKVNPNRAIVFENDTLEINKAVFSGVTPENTINVKT